MKSLSPFDASDACFPAGSNVLVQTLAHLDALVGRYVTEVSPVVFWEDTCTQWRFETLAEALEAMRDPFFTGFAAEQDRCRSSLREVHEFPDYSSELEMAMAVVEQLSTEAKPLTLSRSFPHWSASFPGGKKVEAARPAVAICLAALRTRGIEVTLELGDEAETGERVIRLGGALVGKGS